MHDCHFVQGSCNLAIIQKVFYEGVSLWNAFNAAQAQDHLAEGHHLP